MKRKPIIISGICLVLALIAVGIFFLNKSMNEKKIAYMISIANKMYKDYQKELLSEPGKEGLTSTYTITNTVIKAGDENEFVAVVYSTMTASQAGDSETVKFVWPMRIKKNSSGKYVTIGQGPHVTEKGLKIIDNTKVQAKKVSKFPVSLSTSNKYKIEGSKVSVTYDNGKHWAKVPASYDQLIKNCDLAQENGKYKTLNYGSFYISPKITAFAYNGMKTGSVLITVSKDKGKSWNSYEIHSNDGGYEYMDKYIGFTSENNGYAVLTTSVAMGHQENYIYETSDGGKTWLEVGNTNNVYARVVTGAGFANDKIGFVGFRYENDSNPTVYMTQDKGITWNKLDIKLPSQYKNDYATPLCPTFKGKYGILPVNLRDSNKTIQFTTKDYGKTWTFDREIKLNESVEIVDNV